MKPNDAVDYSVVIPAYNEAESIEELSAKINEVFGKLDGAYEVLYIDDGSTDGTLHTMKSERDRNPSIRVYSFRANFGKAAALDFGFQKARGRVIITMDADLQDDPQEIPRMIAKLHEGFDLVSGWKRKRHDPLHKTLPSRLFNFVLGRFAGLRLHDFNCGFKAYRSEVVKGIRLYGEMHRYIPALAYRNGFTVTEIPVTHHARKYGKSKYGIERFLRGLFDFLTVMFITKYQAKPMHFFGVFGFLFVAVGFLVNLYLTVEWFLLHVLRGAEGVLSNRPLLLFGVLMIVVGLQFFFTGLLAEIMLHFNRQRAVGPDHSIVREAYD